MGEERALQPPRSDALDVLDEKMNPRQRVKPLVCWLVCSWRVKLKTKYASYHCSLGSTPRLAQSVKNELMSVW